MLGNAFGWPHLIVILVVILLLFGAPKLPGLAKSLGQSMRIFRKEVSTMKEEKAADAERRPDASSDDIEAEADRTFPDTPRSDDAQPSVRTTPTGQASRPKP